MGPCLVLVRQINVHISLPDITIQEASVKESRIWIFVSQSKIIQV